jgi:hypothetical protein
VVVHFTHALGCNQLPTLLLLRLLLLLLLQVTCLTPP